MDPDARDAKLNQINHLSRCDRFPKLVNHMLDFEFRASCLGLFFAVADLQDDRFPQLLNPLKVSVLKPVSSRRLPRMHLELLDLAPSRRGFRVQGFRYEIWGLGFPPFSP